MEKKKNKSFKSIIITTITILIITNIITSLDHFLDFKKHRPEGKLYWYGYVRWPEFKNETLRSCWFNIRDLQDAVDCYDMADNKMMTVLDIDKLLEEGYLRKNPTNYHSNCKYISKGDLTENGKIYCELHGSLSEIEQKMEIEKKKKEQRYTIYFCRIRILPALFYFIYALISLTI